MNKKQNAINGGAVHLKKSASKSRYRFMTASKEVERAHGPRHRLGLRQIARLDEELNAANNVQHAPFGERANFVV